LALKVSPEQEKFVASNSVSLAQAHFEKVLPWFRAIYADEDPVGFIMVEFDEELSCWYLWRYMVDARYQGMGYGRRALELAMDYLRGEDRSKDFYTSCVPGPGSPGPFYEKLGFVYTGEQEGVELVMKRALP